MIGPKAGLKAGLVLAGACVAIVIAVAPAAANPGAVDRDFGGNGRVFAPLGLAPGFRTPPQAAVAPDGGVFLAGSEATGSMPAADSRETLRLRHYLPEGQLDPGFGTAGTLAFSLPASLDVKFELSDFAVDAEGRLLLFGTAYPPAPPVSAPYPSLADQGPSYAAVVRLLPNGGMDPDFGAGNGIAMFDFAAQLPPLEGKPRVHAAKGAVDRAGRIDVVIAQTENDDEGGRSIVWNDRLTARLTSEGGLDPSFGGGDGVVSLDPLRHVADLEVGPRDEIVIGGSAAGARGVAALLRLRPDGSRKTRFGVNGLARYGRGGFRLEETAVDRFGRVLLLGHVGNPLLGEGPRRIVRLSRRGSLDRGFGRRGRLDPAGSADRALSGMVTDGRARILIAGTYPHGPRNRIAVLRRLPSGRPDPAFGRHGRAITRIGNASASARELALDGHGHALVAGLAQPACCQGSMQLLVRYDLR